MNAIELLSAQPWVERLGWTLVHFLWQGLAIAVVYAVACRIRSGPTARYLLACAALAAMMAAPVVTCVVMQRSGADADTAYRIRSTPPAVSAAEVATRTAGALSTFVRPTVSKVPPDRFLPWVVMLWLVGAAAFWVRLAGGWIVAARMRSMAVRRAPPEWQDSLRRLGARIGLSRPVRLLVSALVQVPTVVGWLRPVVLVPVGALGGMPAEHLEALLLHELAHIRRHDYLINMLQSVAEALLFYHPAVWWVSSHIRAGRELCCDDVAAGATGDVLTYARALAQLESYRPTRLGAAIAADGGSLADRIARLLERPRPTVRTGAGPGVLTVAILLVAAAYGLFGQAGAHPAFQVASIKRNASDWSERMHQPMGGGYQPGGRLVMRNSSLLLLIQFAYAAHDNPMNGHWRPLLASQVAGGPSWINSVGYDIEAKPEGATDPQHVWLMLETLLADRFKLALHRETRELPVYALTAAKNGFKLPAAKEAECISFPPGTAPRFVAGKVDCGYVSGPFQGARGARTGELRIEGRKIYMADLIRELAVVLDRPVLDKTGFNGEFDLTLSFTPDEASAGFPGFGLGDSKLPTDPNVPNIFAALEEQLGLKLVAAKGPVEVLVIDHAERPGAN